MPQLALTHPSIAHEASGVIPHNQRLEFLGDAVLSLVLTEELYLKFVSVGEGPLTKAEAHAFRERWRKVNAREVEELRSTDLDVKWQQFNTLLSWARQLPGVFRSRSTT